jgi:hypothetical protein
MWYFMHLTSVALVVAALVWYHQRRNVLSASLVVTAVCTAVLIIHNSEVERRYAAQCAEESFVYLQEVCDDLRAENDELRRELLKAHARVKELRDALDKQKQPGMPRPVRFIGNPPVYFPLGVR